MGIVSMNGVSSAFFGKVEQLLQIHIISMEVPIYCWLSIGVGIYDQTLQILQLEKKSSVIPCAWGWTSTQRVVFLKVHPT